MFLFRERRLPATAPTSGAGQSGGGSSDAGASGSASAGGREFLAFKAARFLGGKALQVKNALARVTAGPNAEALRTDLESRASSSRESLAAAVVEWGPLLTASDDTPRYEAAGGGPPLTFKAAFLYSRAFELALAAVGSLPAAPAKGSGAVKSADVVLRVDNAGWRTFLRGAVLPGGEEVACELPDLFATTRQFPDCRRWVEEATLAIKADAKVEQLRCERVAAGSRAEQLRAALRGLAPGGPTTAEAQVTASREAVGLYSTFRFTLRETVAHLRDGVLATRKNRLRKAQENLADLAAEVEQRRVDASARRDEVLRHRDEALAVPRREIEALERDTGRFQADERARELEDHRRQLQMELEEASQELAAQRDERLALLRRRESAVAEHRQRTEGAEQQLRELLPAQFHKTLGPRASAMTEGEILAGLGRSTELARGLVDSARRAAKTKTVNAGGDLEAMLGVVGQQASAALKEHANLELARLEAAGTAALSAAATLLEGSRSRSAYATMGLEPAEEMLPSRRDVRRLRRALAQAEEAWQEADGYWGSVAGGSEEGDTFTAAMAELAPSAVSALEASRGRIAHGLEQLRQADPELYELALVSERESPATDLQEAAPHGADYGVGPHGGDYGVGAHGADYGVGGAASSSSHAAVAPHGRVRTGTAAAAASAVAAESRYAGELDAQAEEEDEQVPHGWEAHTSPEGDIYYYSLVTGETQWEIPDQDAAVAAGWRLFQADDGNWFYHNPYDGAGLWYPDLPNYAAEPAPLEALGMDARGG
eukprot:TRINITY_DN11833_c0_g1_i1.p1 TRINITY_DN11833_c0_g1~~TRINITY_DN11833_c0_g1_i1.p1  ORF type:complete len:824 (-),score=187.41 TRINITY_DN11833_c0_g1_i1:66-2390(-)